jgi:hypothetical protein
MNLQKKCLEYVNSLQISNNWSEHENVSVDETLYYLSITKIHAKKLFQKIKIKMRAWDLNSRHSEQNIPFQTI